MQDPLAGDEETPDNVRSIADRAANGEHEEDDLELFPLGSLEGDPKTTLKTLIKTGKPIEYTVSLRSAEVPLRGGLPDPDAFHRIFVNSTLEKVETVMLRENDKVVGYKVRAILRPVYVEHAQQEQPDEATG